MVKSRADYLREKAELRAQEEALFQALRTSVIAKRVSVKTDGLHLNQADSPVHDPWDHLAPLLLLMVAPMVVMIFLGLAIGMVAMTAAILVYIFGMRTWISLRIQTRVMLLGLRSAHAWKTIWKYGGIALVRNDPFATVPCIAPDGDWRAFVRRLESDYNPQVDRFSPPEEEEEAS